MSNQQFQDTIYDLDIGGSFAREERDEQLFYVPENKLLSIIEYLLKKGYTEIINSDDESE